MELVNAVEIVPREMRNPPTITTSWKPNRLLSTDDKGAEEEKNHGQGDKNACNGKISNEMFPTCIDVYFLYKKPNTKKFLDLALF